ncbi:testis-specific serine/threonine-protein kinase 1-like [Clupea harengus]|uniref:non-specific serine/threonine protein kinase n=1 Tax=Clupea harengus TaxID=7950 RepID=A0A6P3WEW6_CLUHA|nr:testis-specific serine/threonine-protein kinase 1-like [Clupea harengus]
MDALVLRKRGYTLGIHLGEGSYAKVKSAYSERRKINVAVKIINRNKAPKDFLDKFLPREIEMMACLSHPNIVKTFEIFETSDGKVYMIMELGVQGNLLEFIKFRGTLPEDFARKIFRQLTAAIKFIHEKNIVHRDLKCENLLLDKDFNMKVGDLGFSRKLSYDGNGDMVLSKTFCGSTAYAAPEVLQGTPYNPKMYDVWSMGVVLFIMVCGSMPFDDSNVRKMLKAQKEHHVAFHRSRNPSAECIALIYSMLHPDPLKRIEIGCVTEHLWLQAKLRADDGNKVRHDESQPSCSVKDGKDEGTHSKDHSKGPKAEVDGKPGHCQAATVNCETTLKA